MSAARCLPGLIASLAFLPVAAHAAEVQFDGAYRARGRMFDTLSLLDRSVEGSEALALYAQHRLWLRPRFLLSDQVAVNVDILGLDNVVWGNRAYVPSGVVIGGPPTYDYLLTAPVVDPNDPDADPEQALQDITLWHAWGEFHTKIGAFRFGRMPIHWGSGVWQNDGLTTAPHYADHGDSADRIEWEYLVIDQFFIRAAVDTNAERFVNEVDDTTAFNLALAFRNEAVSAGANMQLQHTVNGGQSSGRFNLFTIDLAATAQLGKLWLESENVAQFGAGDLTADLDDVNVAAYGGIVVGALDLDPWGLRVEGGVATGDGSPNDQSLRAFTFDPDYSVGIMLFEQPLPTLAAALGTDANQNRSFDEALTGNAISNAMYLKPTVSRKIVDGVGVHVSWLGARVAKVPELFGDRKSYGMEVQVGADWTAIEHVDLGLDLGTFLPGSYFKNLPGDTYTNFDRAAFGGQLSTRITF